MRPTCWCGFEPQGDPSNRARNLKRHVARHDTPTRATFPERAALMTRTRLAHERAVSLCKMHLFGKVTGQWANCSYGHLTDSQVIETILLILEDE